MSEQSATVPLGSVTTWLSGGTPDRANKTYWTGSVPWISAATLKRTRIYDSDQRITEAAVRAGSKLAPQGATLVLVRGMALRHEVRAGLATRPVSFNQDVKALIPRPCLLPEYLTYSLHAQRARILELVSSAGSGTGVLDVDLLKRLPIWLPKVREQKVIIDAIDDAESAVEALERLLSKKAAIKHGMMQQLLVGKTRLPGFTGPWPATTLGTLGTFLKGRGVKREDVRDVGIPCVRYGELYTVFDDYTSETRSFVDPEIAATALPLRSGDLMFTCSGEIREEIGKCVAYLGGTPAVAGGDIIVLRGNGFNSVYLALLANMPAMVNQKARSGQGDAVVHINSRALSAVRLDLPPLDEQGAIASVLIEANNELDTLSRHLQKARFIEQGMMQELFTGRTRLLSKESAA